MIRVSNVLKMEVTMLEKHYYNKSHELKMNFINKCGTTTFKRSYCYKSFLSFVRLLIK